MNERLPPIDPDVREQLARRAGGRLPDALMTEVFTALDSTSPRRTIWRVPRVAVAGMSMALVAILAATIAFSAVRTAPAATSPSLAGYPAERALTTAELASLMAGPALPVNAALVAAVTIDAHNDACPMNSRPTVGVIEGMGAQVCVMGAELSAQQLSVPAATGTFAFRYLAPGYLGLVGEITPASSTKTAFRVADDWPLQGKTFLVEGWLGAEGLTVSCVWAPTLGEVLSPNGEDCPYDNWLGDDPTAPGIQADHEYGPGSPLPSYDPLSLRGNARHVGAGGMRIIDSIDHETPVRGVYVVRSIVEACAGDPPQSFRGCGAWRVLAKVTGVSAPVANGTPVQTPSPTPPAATPPTGYPVDRALTAEELAAVMAGPALATNTTLVAAVTIDSSEAGTPGCFMSDNPTIGAVRGMRTLVCLFGGGPTPARIPGIFAFRYLGPGALDLLGQITPASSSRPVFGATRWPWSLNGWDTFLVGGYLIREPTGWRIADTLNGPTPSTNTFQSVQVDAAAGIDSMDPSQYGVFVVTAVTVSVPASSMGPQGDDIVFHIVAKVADISVPGAAASPSPSPRESPAGPPGTPLAPALTGVIGTGNQPLTVDELETLMVAQPDHLAGRIVIIEAPIPTQISCQSDANGGGCTVNTKPLAQTGIWAVSIGAEGALRLVGQIATPGGRLVVSVGDTNVAPSAPIDEFLIVDGWLDWGAGYECDATPRPTSAYCDTPGLDPYLIGMPGVTAFRELVQSAAFQNFGSENLNAGPVQGLYLVHLCTSCSRDEILARLEPTVTP